MSLHPSCQPPQFAAKLFNHGMVFCWPTDLHRICDGRMVVILVYIVRAEGVLSARWTPGRGGSILCATFCCVQHTFFTA